jgi:hypothetical protein
MGQEEKYLGKSVSVFDSKSQPFWNSLQVAPQEAAEASMVCLFHPLITSRIPCSSSPRLVNPVTRRFAMMDFPVAGSMIPGKIAPPWHLKRYQDRDNVSAWSSLYPGVIRTRQIQYRQQ